MSTKSAELGEVPDRIELRSPGLSKLPTKSIAALSIAIGAFIDGLFWMFFIGKLTTLADNFPNPEALNDEEEISADVAGTKHNYPKLSGVRPRDFPLANKENHIELDDENTQNHCFHVSLDINIPDLLAYSTTDPSSL